jgi:phosphatidylglycerol:prolipoprotein diacylglycerol transferase
VSPEVVFPNLGITIQHLPTVAFHIGSLAVYWYGVLIVLGILLATLWGIHEAKRVGHNPDHYTDFLFYALIFSLIGARLYYVVFSWDQYKNNLASIFAFRQGGLAIYGGVIAAFATAIVYTRIKKLNFWSFTDVGAPCLLIGQAIGRWGNFFNREVFGHYTESLFAMRYLAEDVSVIPPSVYDRMVQVDGASYIQVQPTFLYESVWNILVFMFINVYKKRKKRDGELALLYLIGYGLGRFYIEGIRTDQLMLFNTGLPVSQVFSALLVAGGAIFFAILRKTPVTAAVNYLPAAEDAVDTIADTVDDTVADTIDDNIDSVVTQNVSENTDAEGEPITNPESEIISETIKEKNC